MISDKSFSATNFDILCLNVAVSEAPKEKADTDEGHLHLMSYYFDNLQTSYNPTV